MKQLGAFSGHTSSNPPWSLKSNCNQIATVGTVIEYISITKTIGHSTLNVGERCGTFSPRLGSPPQMESACDVWWWPWCRWSPGQWWCHFCSCLFVRKLDGHVLTAAPAATHTHTHMEKQGLYYRQTEKHNTGRQMKVWKCHCWTDVQGRCDSVRHWLL